MTNYFFVSSPLHFITTCAMVISLRMQTNVLIIISKNKMISNQLSAVSKEFPDFFQQVVDLTSINTIKSKLKLLDTLLTDSNLVTVYSGNDRRYEFQYLIAKAKKLNSQSKGVYLDDGAVSYTGHKSLNNFAHKYIDPYLKKVIYGPWYKQALTIGCSPWVDKGYLFFPTFAHKLLQNKELHPLCPQILGSDEYQKVNDAILSQAGDLSDAAFKQLNVIICLPHEAIYQKDPSYFDKVKSHILAQTKNKEIGIKPHPRSQNIKLLEESFKGSLMLPNAIGMESMLVKIDENTTIIGDISSALLTAKWLKPRLNVVAMCSDPRSPLIPLFKKLAIKIVS